MNFNINLLCSFYIYKIELIKKNLKPIFLALSYVNKLSLSDPICKHIISQTVGGDEPLSKFRHKIKSIKNELLTKEWDSHQNICTSILMNCQAIQMHYKSDNILLLHMNKNTIAKNFTYQAKHTWKLPF